jgi:hypothetical protein
MTIIILLALCTLALATPPALQGFSCTWSDDFVGNYNSLPNTANWRVLTGTGYPGSSPRWGTGQIETYTSNPNNLKLTSYGNLEITPLRDGNGNWTWAKIETNRCDFQA